MLYVFHDVQFVLRQLDAGEQVVNYKMLALMCVPQLVYGKTEHICKYVLL